MKKSEIMEKLAELEHDQWVCWSKALSEDEILSLERLTRWKELWIPYRDLPEITKNQDRMWARKAWEIMRKIQVKK